MSPLRGVKAKEMEDLYRISDASVEIAKRSGALWECIDRKPNQGDGYIYTFRLRFDAQACAAKLKEIYPSVEPVPRGSILTLLNKKAKWIPPEKYQYGRLLNRLGFESDGYYLHLPDREAFLERWENLREEREDLPALDILSSEGVASDREFIDAFFTHDFIISNGQEFVHDLTAHLMPTLIIILSEGNYKGYRSKLVKQVAKEYKMAAASRKIEVLVGALVDVISSRFSQSAGLKAAQGGIEGIASSEAWFNYFRCRLGAF